jgi:hypothetical protein
MPLESSSLETMRPFSSAPRRSEVHAISETLLRVLSLDGGVTVIEADASATLRAEAYFRRRWWSGAEDPFRDASHASKLRAHTVSGSGARATQAWSMMGRHVRSSAWRSHLRRLSEGRTDTQIGYLRLAFGAAQQLWTRAARWDAALAPQPNPFAVMARLFEQSCWPIGWNDGCLCVCAFCPQDESRGGSLFPEFKLQTAESNPSEVFLSAPFRERSTRDVLHELAQRGWTVVHGRVDERIAPERQLGARIESASVTVGALLRTDPDFGIPWWTFQELDFARACCRPVALLSGGPRPVSHSGFETFILNEEIIEDRFWQWLEFNSHTRYE